MPRPELLEKTNALIARCEDEIIAAGSIPPVAVLSTMRSLEKLKRRLEAEYVEDFPNRFLLMSADEIRTQKALALLELKEAEIKLSRIEDGCANFIADLRSLADVMEKNPDSSSELFYTNYSRIDTKVAGSILSELQEAKKELVNAKQKISHFGF